jgi:hypothetical protein
MKKFCIGLSLVLVTTLTGTASAGTDFLIDWGNAGNAIANGYTLATHNHPGGQSLTVYAVTGEAYQADPFNGPLDFLETGSNANEYTIVITANSLGTVPLGGGIFYTIYAPGSFAVYEDAAANADFANVGTFTDGTLIIDGTTLNMSTQINDFFACPPGVFGNLTCDLVYGNGGTFGSFVAGCTGGIDATYTDDDCQVAIPAGYTHHANGQFSIENGCGGSTATEEGTWSGVKGLFR